MIDMIDVYFPFIWQVITRLFGWFRPVRRFIGGNWERWDKVEWWNRSNKLTFSFWINAIYGGPFYWAPVNEFTRKDNGQLGFYACGKPYLIQRTATETHGTNRFVTFN